MNEWMNEEREKKRRAANQEKEEEKRERKKSILLRCLWFQCVCVAKLARRERTRKRNHVTYATDAVLLFSSLLCRHRSINDQYFKSSAIFLRKAILSHGWTSPNIRIEWSWNERSTVDQHNSSDFFCDFLPSESGVFNHLLFQSVSAVDTTTCVLVDIALTILKAIAVLFYTIEMHTRKDLGL